jgi:hypothetical protein
MDEDEKALVRSEAEMDRLMEVIADGVSEERLSLIYEIGSLAIDGITLPDYDKETMRALLMIGANKVFAVKSRKE